MKTIPTLEKWLGAISSPPLVWTRVDRKKQRRGFGGKPPLGGECLHFKTGGGLITAHTSTEKGG